MPPLPALDIARRYAAWSTREPEAVAADLVGYADLLTKWNRRRNLVSRETGAELWSRHIADSLQLVRLLRPSDAVLVDCGSGGGLPAIPMAIARLGGPPHFRLIEANGGKAAFLRAASRELRLDFEVVVDRVETMAPRAEALPDVVTARALAPLPGLCGLLAPLMGPETRALFPKGREYGAELAAAAALWQYDVIVHASDSSEDGVILEISRLSAR